MATCRDITERATDYEDDALDPDSRRSFEEHLASCSGCRIWLGQLRLTAKLARAIPPPRLPAEAERTLLRRFDEWQAGERGSARSRLAWEGMFASAAVVAILVSLARNPSRAPVDWLLAVALSAGALALVGLARRLTFRIAAAVVSAAFVAAAIRGGSGSIAAPAGLDCLLTEATGALAMAGVAWAARRWWRRAGSRSAWTVWAVAGGLAAEAALQIACPHHASLAHLAIFHAGGMLVIAAIAVTAERVAQEA